MIWKLHLFIINTACNVFGFETFSNDFSGGIWTSLGHWIIIMLLKRDPYSTANNLWVAIKKIYSSTGFIIEHPYWIGMLS